MKIEVVFCVVNEDKLRIGVSNFRKTRTIELTDKFFSKN